MRRRRDSKARLLLRAFTWRLELVGSEPFILRALAILISFFLIYQIVGR